MAEKEEKETGFIGQIRRLSRRLSGNILSADVRDVKAYLVRNDKRNIYTYDSEEQMRIGKTHSAARTHSPNARSSFQAASRSKIWLKSLGLRCTSTTSIESMTTITFTTAR